MFQGFPLVPWHWPLFDSGEACSMGRYLVCGTYFVRIRVQPGTAEFTRG